MSMMHYYDARIGHSTYGGLFNPLTRTPSVTYDAFLCFGALYALGTETQITGMPKDVYAMAATDGKDKGVMLVNTGRKKELSLPLADNFYAYSIKGGRRIAEVKLDPSCFTLSQNEIVCFATKPLEILK
jgi:hypothetical protein